ncbi:MAG: permease-like cell division protein FtsX, partial [Lachnospiraceae bacterium]|nr:permease-like cell division protein FtsX [Lachnospiraceae bacterium]
CIFLFGLFYSISVNFSGMVKNAERGVAVTVYFDDKATQDEIDQIGIAIGKRKEVARYNFVSADEAWKRFQSDYFKGHSDAAESFADDNPLADMANYEIYLKDVSKQAGLVSYLQGLAGVREVHQSATTARTLTDFNALVRWISLGIIFILIAVAAFLISNTVSVGISVRKEEIAIMKLIGARDAFVRAPFVVEGILIGLIGSIIPLVILAIVYNNIIHYVAERFDALKSMFSFVSAGNIFHVLIPVSLLLGVGIGYAGSRVTLKRHLNV